MKRRDFLKSVGASSLTLSLNPASQARAGSKPNILFLFTDDHRYDTIHALGNEQILTPHIDSLVESGTAFTQAFNMGGMTIGVCLPSRAMLMTGRYLFHLHNGYKGNAGGTLPPEHKTLPETLQHAGYHTFQTGKWHNDRDSHTRSFTTAKKILFGGMSSQYNVPIHDFRPAGNYPKEPDYWVTDQHSAEMYGDAAVGFLEEYTEDNPFFMFVSFQTPHDPRHMPQEYRDMYDHETIPVPDNFLPVHPFNFGEANMRDEQLERWPRTPDAIKRHIADYYAMITHTDAQIGRILDALKQSGKYDDTIIVFAGDNGLAVGQHGLMGKQHLYDCATHVPLVFSGPGIPKNEKRDALVYLMDIFPTLCDLTGTSIPETVESHSLWPVINGDSEDVRDSIFFAFKYWQRAVQTKKWKLLYFNFYGEKHTMLYDMENDPLEVVNLYHNPAYADVVKDMRSRIEEWFEITDDRVKLDEPDWGVEPLPPWKAGNWNDPNPDVYQEERWPGRQY